MKHICALYILLLSLPALSQSTAPGGVDGAWQWWYPQSNTMSDHRWQMGNEAISYTTDESTLVNYWPSPNWQRLSLPAALQLPAAFGGSATIFIVYQPTSAEQEEVLWSWQDGDQRPLVSTNKRLADLEQRHYLNFLDERPITRLQTYRHATGATIPQQSRTFALGQLTTYASIPAGQWSSALAEFILFPKILEREEQLRVESYLALKYGTTLGLPGKGADYLSSTGAILWKAEAQQDYHFRVFGLGKDTGSGWEQGRSYSAEAPDLLEVQLNGSASQNGLTPLALPDQHFCLIGDNNGELNWQSSSEQEGWELLERNWLVQFTGDFTGIPMDVRFDLGRWLGPDNDAYEYHIVTNRNENDQIEMDNGEAFPMTQLQKGRFGQFANIYWPAGSQARFTLARRLLGENGSIEQALRVYPNPIREGRTWQWQLRLSTPTPLLASLSNAKGQTCWERSYTTDTYFAAEEPSLPTGTYWLTLRAGEQTFTQKIVVQ